MARRYRVVIPVGSLTLLICETAVVACAFILSCYLMLEHESTVYLLYDGGIYRVLLVTLSIIIGLYFQDLYTNIYVRSHIVLLQQLSLIMGMAFLIQAIIGYGSQNLRMPLRLMLPGSAISMLAIFGWRAIYARYVIHVIGGERLLFVGRNAVVEAIVNHVRLHPELGIAVLGFIDDGVDPGTIWAGSKVLGPIGCVREIATQMAPDRIVVGLSERRQCMPIADLADLRFSGIMIEEASTAYESLCRRISTRELRPSQLIFTGELGPRRRALVLHSFYNLVLALLATVLFLPLMMIIAFCIRMSSPGPVFCRQMRVGLDGGLFTLFKFRSMQADRETGIGGVWTGKDDQRVTRLGRFLRKHRIDELPQVFNVLRGDMVIVGPRPERPEFVKTLSEQIPFYRQRLCVKPGITGWAQINHKYADTPEDIITKLEYDLYYIKNSSFILDGYIMLQTLKTMFLSRGSR